MTTIDDGGPAYPGNHHDGKAAIGASLRDVFAMHAMQGKLACGLWSHLAPPQLAVTAYEIADAMLAARKVTR